MSAPFSRDLAGDGLTLSLRVCAELVDEWSAPLPAPSASTKRTPAPAAQILRQLVDFLASPEGKRVGMHAPIELRFSRVKGEDFYLSPAASYGELLGREEDEDDLVMWFEPIMCVVVWPPMVTDSR